MTDKPEILALIAKYLNNSEDLELKAKVEEYRLQSEENEVFYQEIERLWLLSERSKVLSRVDEKKSVASFNKRLSATSRTTSPTKTIRRSIFVRLRWTAAAVVLIALASSVYFYKENFSLTKERVYASDATPGGNKAILVLSDGRKISLTDVNNGDVANQAGLSIKKTADGKLIYTVSGGDEIKERKNDHDVFNTIETPKGGMWQVLLPDGSSVWLNAVSSLKYPLSFSKGKKRIVELKGEAYFEVAKDKLHPFVVKTSRQEVEVLGTSFNVNSYTDEVSVKTTLLEGSVKVYPIQSEGQEANTLQPGEQSILNAKGINVVKVDADEAIDWKNGYFMFNNERQESIMRKLSRWYNVQIEYADAEAKNVTYYGSVSRFDNVSKVLRKFEQTGEVRFEINKNKITVYKENNN